MSKSKIIATTEGRVEHVVMPLVIDDDDGIRPAGKPDVCFYCHRKVGEEHKKDCVCLYRKVKVKYTYEIEIEVPHFWGKHEIEFHRNESSSCADNTINELEIFAENNNCLCNFFKAEVLEIPEAKPYRKNKNNEVVA